VLPVLVLNLPGLLVEVVVVELELRADSLLVVMVVVERVPTTLIIHPYQFIKIDLVKLELAVAVVLVQTELITMLVVVVVVSSLSDIKLHLFPLKKQLVDL